MAADVWGAFSADPRDPAVAALRASDADRDHAADVVRDAFVDGRLAHDEFDVRRDEVLQARTLGDLLPLMRDLVPTTDSPAASVERRPTGASALARDAQRQYERDLRDARNGWVFVTTVCVAIWGASSIAADGPYFFWPVFPFIGVGIGYLSPRLNREKRVEEIEEKLVRKRLDERRRDDY